MNKLEELLNNMTEEERADYNKKMSELDGIGRALNLDYGGMAGLMLFFLLGGEQAESFIKKLAKQRIDDEFTYAQELAKNNFEITKAFEKEFDKLIEDCHRNICDYLYLNNIHLIKTIKDGKYEEITSYEMADHIKKQLKENM